MGTGNCMCFLFIKHAKSLINSNIASFLLLRKVEDMFPAYLEYKIYNFYGMQFDWTGLLLKLWIVIIIINNDDRTFNQGNI